MEGFIGRNWFTQLLKLASLEICKGSRDKMMLPPKSKGNLNRNSPLSAVIDLFSETFN